MRITATTTAATTTQRSWIVVCGVLLLLITLVPPSHQCGPGRGAGRRRGNRKMTPLVFKQHVPNVAENTLMASGLADGRIDRNSPEFKNLVTNMNPEIIFKDEEGTGADRLMSQRCKDKLTTLSISVMNQWPGVRLRVTEAWDEDDHHAVDSLHYEGRAVDITTSDRDKSKYGTLARLAYEAGFDWVYYESRGHIHCSVKSDTSIAVETGGCFPAASTVTLEDGSSKTMAQLSPGDRVMATDSSGDIVFSDIIMFFHRARNQSTTYYVIKLDNNQVLRITGSHLVYVAKSKMATFSKAEVMYAGKVEAGMYLFTQSDSGVKAHRVVDISGSNQRGIYAPLTKHGTIVVDNVAVSCYAWIESHTIAHASLLPVRLYDDVSKLLGWAEQDGGGVSSTHEQGRSAGVHWYAGLLHSLAPYVVPRHLLFSSL